MLYVEKKILNIFLLGSLLLIIADSYKKHYSRAKRMISTFRCYVTDQRLTILDYDENKTDGRYRAVINEDKIAVLQLQSVDTDSNSDLSQLSLCPGVLESNVLQLLSSTTDYVVQLFIEKVDNDIVYR